MAGSKTKPPSLYRTQGDSTDVDLAASWNACAIIGGGAVSCWSTDAPEPTGIDGISGATSIAVGEAHACAVVTGGTIKCWGGAGQFGSLGDGTNDSSAVPVDVVDITAATAVVIGNDNDLHSGHTCAVDAGGVKCWGYNNQGQLGDGTTGLVSNIPVNALGISGATVVSAGEKSSCAIVAGGAVMCWGWLVRTLEDGSLTDSAVPVDVAGLAGATAISGPGAHTCAVVDSGGVKCWGSNTFGQLGDGTTITSSTPVDVVGLS